MAHVHRPADPGNPSPVTVESDALNLREFDRWTKLAALAFEHREAMGFGPPVIRRLLNEAATASSQVVLVDTRATETYVDAYDRFTEIRAAVDAWSPPRPKARADVAVGLFGAHAEGSA